jgi:hypothetical protein
LLKIVKSLRIIALHGKTSSVPVRRGRGDRRRVARQWRVREVFVADVPGYPRTPLDPDAAIDIDAALDD